jgi:hypothetical protein
VANILAFRKQAVISLVFWRSIHQSTIPNAVLTNSWKSPIRRDFFNPGEFFIF